MDGLKSSQQEVRRDCVKVWVFNQITKQQQRKLRRTFLAAFAGHRQ
jgi:hypothetical protein